MTLRSRLKGAAINAYLGADRARHAAAELRRRVRRAPRTVDFWFDLADPASYLAAQAALRLLDAYPIELGFHLVSPPASDVDPAPTLRPVHAIRDAALLASHWDVDFGGSKPLEPGALRKAGQVLIVPRPDREQLAIATDLARALWTQDGKRLTALMGQHGTESAGMLAPHLASSYDSLRRAGHYQGATFSYGGDWYLGIERLHYLEARLAADLGAPAAPVLRPRPAGERPVERLTRGDGPPVIDFWFSFRSPYSYLALARTATLPDQFGVELRVRPILPMVTRGLPVPRTKRMYLARDAKREADRQGIPFGNICDPLGAGVERAMAVARAAIDAGRGLEFLTSAATGIWSEARDLTDPDDLRALVERAGLDWSTAQAALADDGWRTWAADNAAELDAAGLWGVPSWKVGDHVTWGQDRFDYLVDRLRRHQAAVAQPAAPEAVAPADPVS